LPINSSGDGESPKACRARLNEKNDAIRARDLSLGEWGRGGELEEGMISDQCRQESNQLA